MALKDDSLQTTLEKSIKPTQTGLFNNYSYNFLVFVKSATCSHGLNKLYHNNFEESSRLSNLYLCYNINFSAPGTFVLWHLRLSAKKSRGSLRFVFHLI